MGRSTHHKRRSLGNDKRDRQRFGVADTLHSVKRRRLSEDHDGMNSAESNTRGTGRDTDENDGWQTVTSKSSRRNRNNPGHSSDSSDTYPKLSSLDKSFQPFRIDQLRDLALYVLADGIGPTWVAVRNRNAIKKVVTVMVPGLDNEMLSRAKDILSAQSVEKKPSPTDDDQIREGMDTDLVPNTNTDTKPELEDTPTVSASRSPLDGDFEWLLAHTFPVRAPGDSKYCKIHSPLQAMLMAPFVDSSDKAASKATSEKTFKPVKTPIIEIIHTADELRDAEYPLHPACLTSSEDALLEHTRRDGSGQSMADGWVDSAVETPIPKPPSDTTSKYVDHITSGLNIYAIDCEMVLTSDDKSSLARVSVVAWPDGKVVLDKFVKPDLPITNYFTQYSGITPKILENVTTRLSDVQKELKELLNQSSIILGHSLESDLNALKMTHPFIVDTSIIFPHPRGLPLRSSLKFLANKYLKREIQIGGASGHDSVEDARAVLDLVKLKCEKGPRFGTTDANGEAIFKRLARASRKDRTPRTSAIVEYGSSPERGLGKDATYAIGCSDDDEILVGMIRAIQGDDDGKQIPAGGVDFVWGRLRALEYARGWNSTTTATSNNESDQNPASTTTESVSQSTPSINAQPPNDLDTTLLQTLAHLQTLRASLPPTTLLMVFSGTSDVRPALHYQAIQSQYRKEFKVKKWDELSVRWTDVEEQALRKAVDDARRGWGWAGVV